MIMGYMNIRFMYIKKRGLISNHFHSQLPVIIDNGLTYKIYVSNRDILNQSRKDNQHKQKSYIRIRQK